jgi:hypothetical protein
MVAEPKSDSGDNPNNVRCKTGRTFRNNKRECLKEEINEFCTKNMRDRGINEFKKGYQPRTNLVRILVIFLQISTLF